MAFLQDKLHYQKGFTTAFRISRIRSLNEMKRLAASLKGMPKGDNMNAVAFVPSPFIAMFTEELRYDQLLIGTDSVSGPIMRVAGETTRGVFQGGLTSFDSSTTSYNGSGFACDFAPTGELSPKDLAVLGCRAVLLGSMDRRVCLGEKPVEIALKAAYSAVNGIRPYICVGELYSEHQRNICTGVMGDQLDPIISILIENDNLCVSDISLIYEPWAEAQGMAPEAAQIADAVGFIRDYFFERISFAPEVLYGGDLGHNSLRSILELDQIQGIVLDADMP